MCGSVIQYRQTGRGQVTNKRSISKYDKRVQSQLTLRLARRHHVIIVVAALLGKTFLVRPTYPVSTILRFPVLLQRAEKRGHAAWHHPAHPRL